MTAIPRALTIAGSDSGGGAGIQTDLRTFTVLGCHGSSALTAITAQNSLGVQGVFPLPPEAVEAQIESVLSDIGTDAAKTGMLFSAEVIQAVARALNRRPIEKLVVDPVMVAKGGAPLLRPDAQDALVREILPRALLVTPNLPEAEALTGVAVTGTETGQEACRRLLDLGPRAVLLKGGHGEGAVVEDLYADLEGNREVLRAPRLPTRHTHGTGCTLSAAVAGHLALGFDLPEAVRKAHGFLQAAIREGYPLGAGHGPTNPYRAARMGGHYGVLERLQAAWEILELANPVGLIPEVCSNLAEALPSARTAEDVAAFPGRLVRCSGRIRRLDGPRFGVSRHLAGLLVEAVRWGSPFRAVMNVRFGADVVEACRLAGLRVQEGVAVEPGGEAPDVLFHRGGVGTEPMVRVFGADAPEVARRVASLWEVLRGA
ncbi:MAG: bifunctional hydroxymethylpyrimidine kinase/phosphomethylpyrimidine kinase [Deltaproteobacteria bacterium]|nr:bifunctional hydroxymethylpyrimidine kinase/phosphomethylpyrimidine kinase [Deltaproteobacteria bacterium]